MAASSQGVKKFKEWLALLDEQGWDEENKKWLVDFWWKHHDDDGKLLPPGKERHDGDESAE